MPKSLENLIEALQDLKARVEAMPPGENLERLIEEGLSEINRGSYEMCLSARQQSTASKPEDFPPS